MEVEKCVLKIDFSLMKVMQLKGREERWRRGRKWGNNVKRKLIFNPNSYCSLISPIFNRHSQRVRIYIGTILENQIILRIYAHILHHRPKIRNIVTKKWKYEKHIRLDVPFLLHICISFSLIGIKYFFVAPYWDNENTNSIMTQTVMQH